MEPKTFLSAGAAALLGIALLSPSAYAIPRTFVSGTGSGTACTRTAPCATFQLAHDATDAGGEINCIDAGNYGAVTITKSITIDCAGTLGAVISAPLNSVIIDAAGGLVRLRNLTINGTAGFAVDFRNGAALFVENCAISNHNEVVSAGIVFNPPDGVAAKLFVSDSVIGNSNSGISIDPQGSGSARVVIDRVRVERNTFGIVANSGSTSPTAVHIRDSISSGNSQIGIFASATGIATVAITLDRTSSTLNGGNGLDASGASRFILLGRSTVIANNRGLFAHGGGQIFSYQNNHLTGNVTDGAPTATLTVK